MQLESTDSQGMEKRVQMACTKQHVRVDGRENSIYTYHHSFIIWWAVLSSSPRHLCMHATLACSGAPVSYLHALWTSHMRQHRQRCYRFC